MGAAGILKEIGQSLLTFIYPLSCPSCGDRILDDSIICPSCLDEITEKATQYGGGSRSIDHVDRVVVLLPYDSRTRSLIHGLKYYGTREIGIVLGEMIGQSLSSDSFPDNTTIVPIPLHDLKLRDRGYNQSEMIATGIMETTGLAVNTSLVERVKETGTQTKLTAEERQENVRDVFAFQGGKVLGGNDVIIVDDVLTTGATVSECARVLKENGVGRITVCVASTPGIDED